MIDMDVQTYLSDRVDDQINWLGVKSDNNKSAFLRFRVLSICLGALITILSPYAGKPGRWQVWIPPLLQLSGAGVAIAGSLLALNQNQENWIRYRTLREALCREKMLFLTGSNEAYCGPDGFHQFVRVVEGIMAQERASWTRQATNWPEPHGNAIPEAGPRPDTKGARTTSPAGVHENRLGPGGHQSASEVGTTAAQQNDPSGSDPP
jgi:hypothetical protein